MGDPGKKRGEGAEGGEKRTPPNKPATTVSLDLPPSNPRARQGVRGADQNQSMGGGGGFATAQRADGAPWDRARDRAEPRQRPDQPEREAEAKDQRFIVENTKQRAMDVEEAR